MVGHAIHPEAASALRDLGGDDARFSARQFTPKIASTADLILTMTNAHRDSVLELAPSKLNQTFTLMEASRLVSAHRAQTVTDLVKFRPFLQPSDRGDITDPIGQGADVFRAVAAQIANLLPPIVDLSAR
ncbi:protein-tyrosine phosphatase [Mycolicibacterium iranicum]|uniref:Protein-tyrosine phosphatase n=1 Tax=Mycolicibacterium iranicum TaxID=912594 RepID=A0A839Q6J9_MYCIR|nr:protein-tyrosine phosphatase [Mycolicibacterium iranicum]